MARETASLDAIADRVLPTGDPGADEQPMLAREASPPRITRRPRVEMFMGVLSWPRVVWRRRTTPVQRARHAATYPRSRGNGARVGALVPIVHNGCAPLGRRRYVAGLVTSTGNLAETTHRCARPA